MTAKNDQQALDRLADILVEDIMDTPGEELLAEVARDYGNPRALANTFDKIALRARRKNEQVVSTDAPTSAARVAVRSRGEYVDRLRGFWQNAIPSLLDVIFPNRMLMLAVSSACLASIAFFAAAPMIFDSTLVEHSGASSQQTGAADEGGVTRGLAPAARPSDPTGHPVDPPSAGNTIPGTYVQIALQRRVSDAQMSVHDLQTQFAKELGDHKTMIREADFGADGIYYRTLVGPFESTDEADRFCSSLKARGRECAIQKE